MKTGMVVVERAFLTEEAEPIKDREQESVWCFTRSERNVRELWSHLL